MDKAIPINLIRYTAIHLMIDIPIVLLLFFVGDLDLVLILVVFGIALLGQIGSIFVKTKNVTINVRDQIIYWNSNGCDAQIEGYVFQESIRLTYMNGPTLCTLRLPKSAFSSNDWYLLTAAA